MREQPQLPLQLMWANNCVTLIFFSFLETNSSTCSESSKAWSLMDLHLEIVLVHANWGHTVRLPLALLSPLCYSWLPIVRKLKQNQYTQDLCLSLITTSYIHNLAIQRCSWPADKWALQEVQREPCLPRNAEQKTTSVKLLPSMSILTVCKQLICF